MTIFVSILAIGFLILIHELGHFLVARGVGMKVEAFSIGFGPALLTVRGKKTLYRVGLLPLGGYVRIAGMVPGDGTDQEDPASFMNKPAWQRFLVILAGPVVNWLFAFLLLSFLLLAGLPRQSSAPVLGSIADGSSASAVGLHPGDRVVAVNGAKTESWGDIQKAINAHRGSPMRIEVERAGRSLVFNATTGADGMLGVSPALEKVRYPFPEALGVAFLQTGRVIGSAVEGIIGLVRGEQKAELVGPVGIVSETVQAAKMSATHLFSILVVISLALALMNLLPLPALDGGRLVFITIAMVRRRPVNPRLEAAIHAVGLLLLFGLILYATWGDIGRQLSKRQAPAAPAASERQAAPDAGR